MHKYYILLLLLLLPGCFIGAAFTANEADYYSRSYERKTVEWNVARLGKESNSDKIGGHFYALYRLGDPYLYKHIMDLYDTRPEIAQKAGYWLDRFMAKYLGAGGGIDHFDYDSSSAVLNSLRIPEGNERRTQGATYAGKWRNMTKEEWLRYIGYWKTLDGSLTKVKSRPYGGKENDKYGFFYIGGVKDPTSLQPIREIYAEGSYTFDYEPWIQLLREPNADFTDANTAQWITPKNIFEVEGWTSVYDVVINGKPMVKIDMPTTKDIPVQTEQ